jgi:Uma2 family endonuclease
MMMRVGKRVLRFDRHRKMGWGFAKRDRTMATMILDPELAQQLIAERAACGGDRFDEVWEGTYMMSPLANNEHQEIQSGLCAAIRNALGWQSPFLILSGANISDREVDWEYNYRCPDVVVLAPDTKAKNCNTHWCGGPDFAVEITSPHDRSRDKFDFYGAVGVGELLLVDRNNWTLEFYRLRKETLTLEAVSSVDDANRIVSRVLQVTFRLLAGPSRPIIEVQRASGGESWLI